MPHEKIKLTITYTVEHFKDWCPETADTDLKAVMFEILSDFLSNPDDSEFFPTFIQGVNVRRTK